MNQRKQTREGFTVSFINLGREAAVLPGESVLQAARKESLSLGASCSGLGQCGSCLIRVISGEFEMPSGGDTRPAAGQEESGWLRACLVRPLSDLVAEVSPRGCASALPSDLRGVEDAPAPVVSPLIRLTAPGKRALGLAVDLGTTNIAGSLIDLESGERLASLDLGNPQAAYGADLISRINHAIRTPGGDRELQSTVVAALQALAVELCARVSASVDGIADLAVAGNTAMHHLLLGLPVSQLGRAPFTAACLDAVDIEARELGLEMKAGACVHLLPNVGGFVGGDHVAALLATEHLWEQGTTLLIDIGTNTEISLIHDGIINTASTASGPALEGGNISCGMRAAMGAIEKVWLSEGEILTQVIGGGEPVGLCGSGVLAAVSALHRAGIINGRGYISPGHPRVSGDGSGMQQYSFAPGVSLTQNDVRAVLLAKAAIRAGVDLLLQEVGLAEGMLDSVLIAGAFGAYIDLAGALALGLFPDLPRERFRQLGNAAGTGVRMALASAEMRIRAQALARRCRHLELNKLPLFQKTFVGRIAIGL